MQPKTTDYNNVWMIDRITNLVVDMAIILTITVLISFINHISVSQNDKFIITNTPFIFYYLIIKFVYYFFLESVFGKTFGKFITNTTVIGKESKKKVNVIIIFWRTLIRNLSIPYIFYSYMLTGNLAQDSMSGTILIRDNHRTITVSILIFILVLLIIIFNLGLMIYLFN
jgi:hypothetical protein